MVTKEEETDLAMETETEFFTCACPHGCGKPTKNIRTDSRVLERMARCEECTTPEHRKAHPDLYRKESARVITPPAPFDPEEVALDLRIAREQQEQNLAVAKQRWRESLPEKFRDAETSHPKIL